MYQSRHQTWSYKTEFPFWMVQSQTAILKDNAVEPAIRVLHCFGQIERLLLTFVLWIRDKQPLSRDECSAVGPKSKVDLQQRFVVEDISCGRKRQGCCHVVVVSLGEHVFIFDE